MCVIIHRPVGHTFPNEEINNCARTNPHGWGIMWAEDGRVQTARGMEMADFWKWYDFLDDKELAIHFRWATHGTKTLDNTHPIEVLNKEDHGRDLWLMHNGVIRTEDILSDKSDTWHFAFFELEPMLREGHGILKTPAFQKMLKDRIGGSKLLFMDNTGDITIVGRSSGVEHAGCWLSNDYSHGSKQPTFRGNNTSKSTYYYAGRGWSHAEWHGEYQSHPHANTVNHGRPAVSPAEKTAEETKEGGKVIQLPPPKTEGKEQSTTTPPAEKAATTNPPAAEPNPAQKAMDKVDAAAWDRAQDDGWDGTDGDEREQASRPPATKLIAEDPNYEGSKDDDDEDIIADAKKDRQALYFNAMTGITWADLLALSKAELLDLVVSYPEDLAEFMAEHAKDFIEGFILRFPDEVHETLADIMQDFRTAA